jgi:SAM-dependent methyltransferase
MQADPQRRATIFGNYAADYERWRPSYPAAAVDWLLPPGATRVADVGAGTGKLTELLVRRGLTVIAVERDPSMLAELRRARPAALPVLGMAESLPLADGTVDAVLVADAWHWFAGRHALAEVCRVLRPGGWLGIVWNQPLPDEHWSHALARLDPDQPVGAPNGLPLVAGLPTGTETTAIPWSWQVSPSQLRGYLSTHSGYAIMDRPEREHRLDLAEQLVTAACAEHRRNTVGWQQLAVCTRWRPAASAGIAG